MTQQTTQPEASTQGITVEDRDAAIRYLSSTRDGLAAEVQELSEAQWKFKPAPDRWSIAEVVEHLAVAEGRMGEIIGRFAEAPPAPADRDARQIDAFVLSEVSRRENKVQAPSRVAPAGLCTGAEALEQFLRQRARTAELLITSPYLRGRLLPHPIFGPWDGYQWILATAAHSVRHTGQIREVKSHPDFPPAGQRGKA